VNGTQASAGAELSVVVPTYDERDNIEELVRRLDRALAGIRWEVLFVDDNSADGTAELVRTLAQADSRVRCIHRIGRRGLASACVEGMLAGAAPFVAVMDADLQHDEGILPQMLAALRGGGLDIVIGSRYVEGGSSEWEGPRAKLSLLGTRLSRLVVSHELKDPMSGFFMLRRTVLYGTIPRLSSIGFKILLDLFASSPVPLRFREIPYRFRNRLAGSSKLDSTAAWDYVLLLLDKLVGRLVPVRFLSFSILGGLGLLVHMTVLALALKALQLEFDQSQAAATLAAMTCNFFLNNLLTYRDQRLRGRKAVRGLLLFYLACGLGAVANVGVATTMFYQHHQWWLAGVAGVLVGAVWNYSATSNFIWRQK
jgi:dolichol-phosphate mannosyltransferase